MYLIIIKCGFFLANCNCTWGGPADQRAPLLWPFHVRSHPDAHPQFPERRGVAWTSSHQRCDACGRVHGVPSSVERHAVRLLHPRGHARVHRRVSDAIHMFMCLQLKQNSLELCHFNKKHYCLIRPDKVKLQDFLLDLWWASLKKLSLNRRTTSRLTVTAPVERCQGYITGKKKRH